METSFPQLSTPRLSLLQITPDDQQFVFEGLSNQQVIQHYGVQFSTFEDTEVQMKWYADLQKEGTGFSWKIKDRITGALMGVVCVYNLQLKHLKAEIGFWLLPQFWNKGFNTEALMEVLNYCKYEWGLHRIEAFVETDNDASIKTLIKTGFQLEGTMRECEIKNGKFISLHMYSILFPGNVAKVL